MNWLIISLIPPFVWALTNHLDKYILNKYFKGRDSGPYMILVSISISTAALLIAIFATQSIILTPLNALILIGAGILSMLGGLFYLFALSEGEPSVVVPLFQLVPIFNYFLGLIFLNEHLSNMQIFGSLLIIGGALAITIEQVEKKFKIQHKILFWMILAGLSHSVFDLIFKPVALHENYWGSMFWVYVGCVVFGIGLFILHKSWRKQVLEIVKQYGAKIVGINLVNDGAGMSAGLIFNYALLITPIALVAVIGNGLQPFFVLLFGIILTLISPKLANENLSKRHLAQKILAILIIFAGTFLLSR